MLYQIAAIASIFAAVVLLAGVLAALLLILLAMWENR